MGRPSKWKPEFVHEARKLCEAGSTDEEIAQQFQIHKATLYEWKKEYPEFSEALKVGKAPADARVELSLYHRAIGYEHDDVDIKCYEGQVIQTPIRKFYPPDTTAAIFWLKNRKPAEWRDKQEYEHSGEMTTKTVPNDELRAHIRAMVREHAESAADLGGTGSKRD